MRTTKQELLRTLQVPQRSPGLVNDIKIGFPFDNYPPTTNHHPLIPLPAPHILTLKSSCSHFSLFSFLSFTLLPLLSLPILSSLSFSVLFHLPWGRAITYPVSPNFIFLNDIKFLSAFIDAFKCCQPSPGVERPFGTLHF